MPNAQHTPSCKVYLHPMTCNRPAQLVAFQLRTGLHIVATPRGNAQAIPALGGVE